jgi:transcriptional regulator with XRE-family HTH domain
VSGIPDEEELAIRRLAANVRRLRSEFQWTTRALAQYTGFSLSFLYRIEHARHKTVSLGTLDRIARAFGVAVGDLVAEVPGHQSQPDRDLALNIVAARVTDLRAEREWTQEQLSSVSGVPRTMIAELERKNRNVSLDVVSRIARSFNVSLIYMLTPRR